MRGDRQVQSARAARFLALHDFFWAGLGSLFRGVDRRLAACGVSFRFRRLILAVDRFNLRWIHRAMFERVHPVVPNPVRDYDAGGPASA